MLFYNMLLKETIIVLYWFGLYSLAQKLSDNLSEHMKWSKNQYLFYFIVVTIVTGYLLHIKYTDRA